MDEDGACLRRATWRRLCTAFLRSALPPLLLLFVSGSFACLFPPFRPSVAPMDRLVCSLVPLVTIRVRERRVGGSWPDAEANGEGQDLTAKGPSADFPACVPHSTRRHQRGSLALRAISPHTSKAIPESALWHSGFQHRSHCGAEAARANRQRNLPLPSSADWRHHPPASRDADGSHRRTAAKANGNRDTTQKIDARNEQWCSAHNVAGIAGRSLLTRQAITTGTTILTEPPTLCHCDSASDVQRRSIVGMHRAKDMEGAYRQLLRSQRVYSDSRIRMRLHPPTKVWRDDGLNSCTLRANPFLAHPPASTSRHAGSHCGRCRWPRMCSRRFNWLPFLSDFFLCVSLAIVVVRCSEAVCH